MAGALVLTLSTNIFAQTNLQFIGANITGEGAIQLYWASQPHHLYELDEADALIDTNTGSITWNKLYDGYPSHGTNTFIGDFGNYDVMPAILHPKNMPMRFYRIVDEDADNDTNDNPSITITSSTNGEVLSGQITISVVATCSNLPIVTTKLYVDGQEMNRSDDGSNYVINTCEWWNGAHVLFAVATARSTLSGPSGVYPVYTSHGVSSYMPVTFSNLISRIAFSQPFFQPSLGQTQEVTATFAANCDWNLQVLDENSNVVRNASGGGNSLTFDWDGTGDGDTNIPDGAYYFYLSAETNGEADEIVGGGSGGSGGGSPPSPDLAHARSFGSDNSELWAIPTGSDDAALPLAMYPPGFDTNQLTIFSATPSQVRAARLSPAKSATFGSGGVHPAYAGASGQNTLTPDRPWTDPIKNSLGDIGVAFFAHLATDSHAVPLNGLGLLGHGGEVQIENSYVNGPFDPIPEAGDCANDFQVTMRKKGWWGPNSFNLSGVTIHVNDLRSASLGGNEIFGRVNVGLFIDHGSYGTSLDYNSDANESLQTYFTSDNPSDASAPWLRLSEFGLGGNLRFMAILACNILRDDNYNSMMEQGALPIGNNLHLLCSASTFVGCGDVGGLWAYNMTKGFFQGGAETVQQAWYDAGHTQYANLNPTNWTYGTIIFRVAGQDNCLNDKLKDYQSTTSGNITHQDQQVYP